MDKQRFSYLLNNYRSLNDRETIELGILQREFPYSQVIRNMTTWGAYHNNLPIKKQQLYLSSVYAVDRAILKDLIISPKVKQDPIAVKKDSDTQNKVFRSTISFGKHTPTKYRKDEVKKSDLKPADSELNKLLRELPQDLYSLKKSRNKFEVTMREIEKTLEEDKTVHLVPDKKIPIKIHFKKEALESELGERVITNNIKGEIATKRIDEKPSIEKVKKKVVTKKIKSIAIKRVIKKTSTKKTIPKKIKKKIAPEKIKSISTKRVIKRASAKKTIPKKIKKKIAPKKIKSISTKRVIKRASAKKTIPKKIKKKIAVKKRPLKKAVVKRVGTKNTPQKKKKSIKKTPQKKRSIVAGRIIKKKTNHKLLSRQAQSKIIDRFINAKPIIIRNKSTKEKLINLSETINTLNKNSMSEVLVRTLIAQGKKDKAIEILKKLIWKMPQKKTYFMTQIKQLEAQM